MRVPAPFLAMLSVAKIHPVLLCSKKEFSGKPLPTNFQFVEPREAEKEYVKAIPVALLGRIFFLSHRKDVFSKTKRAEREYLRLSFLCTHLIFI